MTPEVSVLIPLFNNETYIGAAIESVLVQDYKDFEIIVADDGSTDHGASVVQSYPGVRYYYRAHGGIAKTRNFCISKATGNYIAFLDSDDLWSPEKLSLQIRYMKENPDCEIVFCRYRNFTDIAEADMNDRQKEILNAEVPRLLATACLKKDLFDRYGLFNEAYSFGEDTEWLARLEVSKANLDHKLDQFLYFRRIHNANITKTHKDMSEKIRYSIYADAIRNKWEREKSD